MRRVGASMDDLLRRLEARCKEETPKDVLAALNRSKARRWSSRALTIGIPSELATFLVRRAKENGETWRETDAISQLANAFEVPGTRLVVLAGPTRTGKSLAAAWWLSHEKGSAYWISAPKLAKVAPWSDEVRRAESADCLVLDDLGLDSEGPKERNQIEALLYERFAVSHQLTVVTTNLPPSATKGMDGFKERYNDRLTSRIKEGGAYLICKTKETRR